MFIFVVIGILIILDFITFLIATKESTNSSLAMLYFSRLLFTSVMLVTLVLILEDFRKKKLKEPIKYEKVTENFYRKIE